MRKQTVQSQQLFTTLAGGSNAPDISDVFLGDDFEFLPTVDMSYTDGKAIRAALKNAERNSFI